MDLHTAGHRRGIAVAPHHLAAAAGRDILAEGGNALEAMVAMAATIAAVYPHMNHVGGDAFWLVRGRPAASARSRRRASPVSRRAPELYREYERSRRGGRSRRSRCRVRWAAGRWRVKPRTRSADGCRGRRCSRPRSATRMTVTRCRAAKRV